MPKFAWYWNQWLVGVMYDEAHILDIGYLVFVIGPLTITFNLGKIKTRRLDG